MEIKADIATVVEEGGAWLLGFVESDRTPIRYLQLQRQDRYDDQDVALGFNQAYIELNDQLWSCYGGLNEIHVAGNVIRFLLNPKGTHELGGITKVIVTYAKGDNFPKEVIAELRAYESSYGVPLRLE